MIELAFLPDPVPVEHALDIFSTLKIPSSFLIGCGAVRDDGLRPRRSIQVRVEICAVCKPTTSVREC